MLLFHLIILKLGDKAFNSMQAKDDHAESSADHPDLPSLAYSKGRSEVLEQQLFSQAANGSPEPPPFQQPKINSPDISRSVNIP